MRILFIALFSLFCSFAAMAEIQLPRLVSDGMVLQRDKPIRIWGRANPRELIRVQFRQQTKSAKADAQGQWTVMLSPESAGGPYEMSLTGENRIVLKDILMGDVWLCSGQSNMELPMRRIGEKYADVIRNSANREIRQFRVSTAYNFKAPQAHLSSGKWEEVNPETILNFSAVAYFFAREIFEALHVPIGLINASVGGTPAESWMSEDALQAFPHYLSKIDKFKDDTYLQTVIQKDERATQDWYHRLSQSDIGQKAGQTPWYDAALNTGSWPLLDMPAYWEEEGLHDLDGVVWLRKTFDLPDYLAALPAKIYLGSMADSDSTFINGALAGSTRQKHAPRIYELPAGRLRPGKNTIVVRVINVSGKGGFVKDKPYHVNIGDTIIGLKGCWQYQIGVKMKPIPTTTTIRYLPLGLYNGMIAPLRNYSLKGFLWYQGEANTARAGEYQQLFPALIKDWRKQFKDNHLPFLYVQLPNYLKQKVNPSESNIAALREAQFKTLQTPYTGMAVTIDIGEWNDIHPSNKEDVGRRLALSALSLVYHRNTTSGSGPLYQSMKTKGNRIEIQFAHTFNGLSVRGNERLPVAIAGVDRKFVWADYRIDKNRLIIWSDALKNPVAVRYAWADNPAGSYLVNSEGLLASPFRTDNWPLTTY